VKDDGSVQALTAKAGTGTAERIFFIGLYSRAYPLLHKDLIGINLGKMF